MKERVLIATYYWPPSGGPGVQRYLKFAKYLPLFDIEPIILTVENPTYPILDPSLEEEIPPDLRVFKTKTIEPFGLYAGLLGQKADSIKPTVELEADNPRTAVGSWIRANIFIPDARTGWYLTARKKAEDLTEKYNIGTIITTGPPHSVHFIGKRLQQTKEIRWLADFRDPWSQVYYNQILPRSSLAEQLDEKLEKGVLKQADEVIVVSPSQAEAFREIFERGYQVITNGFDPADFQNLQYTPPPAGSFLLRHTGTIGEAAVPEAFLEAVAELYDELPAGAPEPVIEFIGEVHARLPHLVKKLELEKSVRFQAYLPHRSALERMCSSDALLLCLPDVREIRHHIPGKLFEYLGSGRPILMVGPTDGDAARILETQNAGYSCGFKDKDSIKNALRELIGRKVGQRGRGEPDPVEPAGAVDTHSEHPYSRITLTGKLSKLISS